VTLSPDAGTRSAGPVRGVATVFIGLQLGMLLASLDATIVATALPTIVRDLGGGSGSGITWVVTGYLLGQVASMPLYGRVGDVFGRKKVFLWAIVAFTVGSMLCGVSQSLAQLCGARVLQGIGAGGLGTLAMAIVADLVPARQLGRWLGYQGAIFAVGGVAGPLLGGLFVDQLSWRWAFFVNLPVALLAMAIVGAKLKVPYRRVPHSIDYLGSALLTGALASVVVLTSAGGRAVPWLSPGTGLLALAAVGFTLAFVRRQRRVPEPFIPLRLLGSSIVRVVGALNFLSGLLFFCGVFFIPVFLQEVAGVSPTVSGLMLIPFMSGTALGVMYAGRRVERTGTYRVWPIVGSVLMTAGAAALAFIGVGTPIGVASLFGAVLGTGIGFVMQTTLLALQNSVDPADIGLATSTALLARILAGTVGTPVFGSILAVGLPAAGATAAEYAHALHPVFWVAVPFGLLSIVAALRLEEHPLREHARFDVSEAGGAV